MLKIAIAMLLLLSISLPALAQHRASKQATVRQGTTSIYPEFRSRYGVIRWLPQQMPLNIYVTHGLCLDGFQDPQLGGPIVNVDNPAAWPPLVARLLNPPGQLNNLPAAAGFLESHYQAALDGINMWKPLESPRTFSLQLTSNPAEAVIFVFFTHHLVNKLGLALFANDIRGMTSKNSVPLKAVLAGGRVVAEPVIILVRTCEADGRPLSPERMKAAVAHEIGHALGIEGHSPNPNDLMSVYYGRGLLSTNDIATINYLYQLNPDYIPKIGRNLAMPVVSQQFQEQPPQEQFPQERLPQEQLPVDNTNQAPQYQYHPASPSTSIPERPGVPMPGSF